MKINPIDKPQRTAAKIAGVAFPVSFAIVVAVNYGVFASLIIRGNPAETARNILTHETLFRIGLAGNMAYCVADVVLLTALYVILKPVSEYVALLAAFGRLIHVLTWILVTLNLFTALRLLSDADYSRAFGPEQLPALAKLYLSGYDGYYVGLLFWGLAGTAGSYLWLKSKYIPSALAAFGLISSAWCAACTFVFYIFPGFPKIVSLSWFDTPMVIFELVLSFWLLFRGLNAGA
jgi:hypothetical protein